MVWKWKRLRIAIEWTSNYFYLIEIKIKITITRQKTCVDVCARAQSTSKRKTFKQSYDIICDTWRLMALFLHDFQYCLIFYNFFCFCRLHLSSFSPFWLCSVSFDHIAASHSHWNMSFEALVSLFLSLLTHSNRIESNVNKMFFII